MVLSLYVASLWHANYKKNFVEKSYTVLLQHILQFSYEIPYLSNKKILTHIENSKKNTPVFTYFNEVADFIELRAETPDDKGTSGSKTKHVSLCIN